MALSLLHTLAEVPLVFLDVETTGSSTAYGDRITEIALLRIERGQVVDRYAQLLNPCRRIWPGVVALTGITNEMVADEPMFDQIAYDVIGRMQNAVIVGHNVSFDLAFVDAELKRVGRPIASVIEIPKVLDTVRIARRLFCRGGNGLQKLAARLEVSVAVAHRAMADCVTTAAVLERMLEPLGGARLSLVDVITLQGGPCRFGGAAEPVMPVELEEAIANASHVRMVYLDARNNRTERVIIPRRLGPPTAEQSLFAYCTLRCEERSFKLSRIVELTRVEVATSPSSG